METPFRFGLERVREIRAHDEDQAKERFADDLAQRVRAEALLRAADDELRHAQCPSRPEAAGGPVSGDALVARQAWVERLERLRHAASSRLDGAEADLARSRAFLTDASRRREVLDQLRHRHLDQHRRDCAVRENAALDEMALNVHARRGAR